MPIDKNNLIIESSGKIHTDDIVRKKPPETKIKIKRKRNIITRGDEKSDRSEMQKKENFFAGGGIVSRIKEFSLISSIKANPILWGFIIIFAIIAIYWLYCGGVSSFSKKVSSSMGFSSGGKSSKNNKKSTNNDGDDSDEDSDSDGDNDDSFDIEDEVRKLNNFHSQLLRNK